VKLCICLERPFHCLPHVCPYGLQLQKSREIKISMLPRLALTDLQISSSVQKFTGQLSQACFQCVMYLCLQCVYVKLRWPRLCFSVDNSCLYDWNKCNLYSVMHNVCVDNWRKWSPACWLTVQVHTASQTSRILTLTSSVVSLIPRKLYHTRLVSSTLFHVSSLSGGVL